MQTVKILKDTRVVKVKDNDFIVEAWDDCSNDYLEVLPDGRYSNFQTVNEALMFARSIDGQCSE